MVDTEAELEEEVAGAAGDERLDGTAVDDAAADWEPNAMEEAEGCANVEEGKADGNVDRGLGKEDVEVDDDDDSGGNEKPLPAVEDDDDDTPVANDSEPAEPTVEPNIVGLAAADCPVNGWSKLAPIALNSGSNCVTVGCG